MPPSRLNLHLLHGWGFDAAVMQPLANVLEQDFTVHREDVPGYTNSSGCCRDMAAIADRLAGVSADADAVLVGWSLGGNVAIHLANLGPIKQPVVLVCCNPCFVKRPDWSCALNLEAVNDLRIKLQQDPKSALGAFAGWCAMGDESTKHTRRSLLEYTASARVDRSSLAVGLDVLSGLDQRASLASLQSPVLMLFAGEDRLVPAATAAACRELSGRITVRVIDNSGHALPVTRPGITAAAIKAFLGL